MTEEHVTTAFTPCRERHSHSAQGALAWPPLTYIVMWESAYRIDTATVLQVCEAQQLCQQQLVHAPNTTRTGLHRAEVVFSLVGYPSKHFMRLYYVTTEYRPECAYYR